MGLFAETVQEAVKQRGAALMGVVNVTPDSFSDGGRYLEPARAQARVDEVIQEGADLVDIGAESSRPGAEPVPAELQIVRLGPALVHAVAAGAVVSVDTTSPEVARWSLGQGAQVVNDVSCLQNPELARAVVSHGAYLIVMHTRGVLGSMRGFSSYPEDSYVDVVEEVLDEWAAARDRAIQAGLERSRIFLDPGLGFAKNARQSLELLQRLSELRRAGAPVVVGPSRKSFLAALDPMPPEGRVGGTIAACLVAVALGATILRVHDVRAVRQSLTVFRALVSLPKQAPHV
ncbi:dihydropteroate synthase [Myxococcota bacterium]